VALLFLINTHLQLDWDNIKDEDITSYSSHKSHTSESNLQGQQAHVTTAEDVRLDKMHPIISDAAMSEDVTPPTVNVISPSENLPVTIATTTTVESAQTMTAKDNQSDFPEVKLDSMHPIISDAIKTDDTVTTTTEDTDDLMKSTSDELMTALEELNTVIGTSNTSSVGAVADHVSHTIKDSSYTTSDHITVSDTGNYDRGSRGSSRQSNHSNIGSRSSSRQSNTGSHENRNGTDSSEDRHKQKPPPAESARALYSFTAQSVK